ncbi:MAG TPA: hypothetical protein PLK99_03470, partial [Burkholderiales bacterium]|nr:hypothetical protein [Burkholderiales bacterium]
ALVIVKVPENQFSGEVQQKYGNFQVASKVEALQKQEGVLQLAATSWLFDTVKAMSALALVVAKAAEYHIETTVIQLPSDMTISQIPFSTEAASKIAAFIAS